MIGLWRTWLRGQAWLRGRAWLPGAALILLATIVYWPTLGNGIIFDDPADVLDNPAIWSLQGLLKNWFALGAGQQYYPLTYSTFWVEYHLWRLDPAGYHVVNFLLHATSAVLIWRLLTRLALPGAWLAAAIFAVHPVEVESVAWVSERRNVLSCALALGSLLAYLRFSPAQGASGSQAEASREGDAWRWYALALGLYVAALLSKSVTASVPAVLLVIYWWKRGRVTWRDAARLAPFFAIGLALACVTVWTETNLIGASGDPLDLSLMERVLVAGRALWFYAGKLAWPHPLILYYPRWTIDTGAWWQYLFPTAALAVIGGLWLARKQIGRGPLAGVLIFAGVLVPGLGFFNVYIFRITYVADHIQYHASVALFALSAAGAMLVLDRLSAPPPWFVPAVCAGLLLPLAIVAQQRTHVFNNNGSLAEDQLRHDPQSLVAHYNLGIYLQGQGKFEDAISPLRKAIEIRNQLVREHPTVSDFQDDLALSYLDLASVQYKAGRRNDAVASRRIVATIREKLARDNPAIIKYKNDAAASHVDVGLLLREMRRPVESENSFRKAIAILERLVRDDPSASGDQVALAWCYVYLAMAQRDGGRVDDATASHRKVIEIREKLARDNPRASSYQNDVAASYVDLGLLERDIGQPADAQTAFQKAIELREKLIQAYPAVAEYQAGLAASYEDLAVSQQASGGPAGAVTSRRRAIELREKLARENPTARAYQNQVAASYVDIGMLLHDMGQPADAEGSFGKAIEIREKLVREHPAVSEYQHGLAWCYVDLAATQHKTGHPADAEVSCRRAIEIREKLVQENPTADDYRNEVAVSYRDLGDLLSTTDRLSEAEGPYRKAIEARQKLVIDYPKNATYQENLTIELLLGGDVLGMLGKWNESADMYAQAVGAGNYSWRSMGLLALVQLAAGNEAGYRATCESLVQRHAESAGSEAALSIALTVVVGDKALADTSQVVVLAKRAVAAAPSSPITAIVAGGAAYRAGRGTRAIPTLTKALAQLDEPAPGAAPDEILVARLMGEMFLARAFHDQGEQEGLQKQLTALRASIGKAEKPLPRAEGGLPPWAVEFAVVIAKRELAKLSTPDPPAGT